MGKTALGLSVFFLVACTIQTGEAPEDDSDDLDREFESSSGNSNRESQNDPVDSDSGDAADIEETVPEPGEDSETTSQDQESEALRRYLMALDPGPPPEASPPAATVCGLDDGCTESPTASPVEYACDYELTRETRVEAEKLVSVGTDPDLWPGNVVKAGTVQAGQMDALNLPLGAYTLYSTLSGSEPINVSEPSGSAYAKALSDLVGDRTEPSGTAVGSNIDVKSIFSIEDISWAVGVDVGTALPVPVGAGLGYRDQTTTTHARVAVHFVQSFFHVSIDPHSSPAGYFASGTTPEDVEQAAGADLPVYVRSVTYGRRVVAIFENHDREDVETFQGEIDAMFNGIEAGAGFERTESMSVETTNFAAMVLGDRRVIGSIDDLFEYLDEPPDISTSWPISYSLQHIANETPFEMGITTEVVTRSCDDCGISDPFADGALEVCRISNVNADHTSCDANTVPLSDADSDAERLLGGVLPPGQVRWFAFDGSDDAWSVVDPQASLSTPGLEVCVFADCLSGATTPRCLLGELTEVDGLTGCCSVDGDAQLTGDGSLCPDKVSDDATVYVRLHLDEGAEECSTYDMTVHY